MADWSSHRLYGYYGLNAAGAGDTIFWLPAQCTLVTVGKPDLATDKLHGGGEDDPTHVGGALYAVDHQYEPLQQRTEPVSVGERIVD